MNLIQLSLLLLITTLAACKNGGGSGTPGPDDHNTEDPSDPSDTGDKQIDRDSGDNDQNTILPGTLAIDLSGAAAVGVAEVTPASALPIEGKTNTGATTAGQVVLSLTDEPTTILTKIKTDGSIVGLELPDAGGTRPVIRKITNVGTSGFIVELDGPGYIPQSPAAMLWINANGQIVPFAPNNYADGVGDFFLALTSQAIDDKLWIHNVNQNALWSFDFDTKSFARFTDSTQLVSGFRIPSDGTVYVQMSLTNTNNVNPPTVLRRVKANGGFEDFRTFSGDNQIDDSFVFRDRVIVYGQPIGIDEEDQIGITLLPKRLMGRRSGRSDAAVNIADQWVAGHLDDKPYAFNLGDDNVAGNPFAASPPDVSQAGTAPNNWMSRVSGIDSLWFDGANLVHPTITGTTITSSLHTKLIYPRGRSLRVLRVFGDDHGFQSTKFGAYAVSRDNKLWYVEIEKATGRVLANEARQIDKATWSINDGATIAEIAQGTTLYNLSGGLVAVGQMPNGNGLAWLVEVDGVLDYVEKKTAAELGMWASTSGSLAMNHAAAVVANGDLFLPGADTYAVRQYDYDSNSFTNIATNNTFSAVLNEDCANDRFIGGLMLHDTNSVAMVFRTCHSNESNQTVAYAETNWSFSAASNVVDLQETLTSTNNLRRLPELIKSNGGTSGGTFLKRWKEEIQLSESSVVDSEDVVTTGLVAFGEPLVAGSGIDVASAWSDNALFISGKNSVDEHQSYRVVPGSRTETHINDLDGVQVYSASRIGDTFLVNGLRLGDNTNVTISFDGSGTRTGIDEVSNIKIVQLVPIGAN